ncbi:MAG: sulfate permease [Planctomycetaceae bacterium]|jgi:SulP family sulfate permease|nr:sulfate permease [Planctomycetaceae bacterium]
MKSVFQPQIISVFKDGYNWKQFSADAIAGVITGIVAIPLSIAFGIASGATPEAGLYTAVIAGFLISLLGGSRVQIGGPTGAFIVIIYGVIQKFGFSGLLAATLMAGVILIAMGLLQFGTILKYIPYPATLGFTSGIAVLIAVTQFRDVFGLTMPEGVPAEFVEKIEAYIHQGRTTNLWAVAVSVLTIALVLFAPKFSKRIPGSLVAIIICTALVALIKIPVETIGTRFKEINMGVPRLQIPTFQLSMFKELLPSAVTIAMLGAIESLLSAVVADGMIGGKHRSNTELIAQGIANLASPLFGGLPATGAIARTATNVKNGGRTPFAGMIHAVVLLIAILCFGRLVALIPMAALGGMLIIVSINMSEYRLFLRMFKAPKSDIIVMLTTFLLTVFMDLTVAIPLGMIMASFLFMRRMEKTFGAGEIHALHRLQTYDPEEDQTALHVFDIPDGVQVYEINGPFFFGAASKFQSLIQSDMPLVLILRMRNVPVIDATGMNAFEDLVKRAQKRKTTVMITGIQPQVRNMLEKFGLLREIGSFNIFKTLTDALPYAAEIVQAELEARRQTHSDSVFSRLTGRSQSKIVKKNISDPPLGEQKN